MSRRGLFSTILLAACLTFTAASCKTTKPSSNQSASGANRNQSTNGASPVKVGKWVAQWHSPAATAVPTAYQALYAYSCICAVSTEVVFAAGDMPFGNQRIGVFVRTTDGGKSWTETRLERPEMKVARINALHFINATTGWLAGLTDKQEIVVLKTVDAGAHWEALKVNFKQVPTAIFFVDENTGWLGGIPLVKEDGKSSSGKAKKARGSKSGGSTAETDNDADNEIGPTDLLVTYDGGKNWQSQRRLPVGLRDIQFLDNSTGWVVGQRGAIYKTTDGGRSWDTQRSELEPGVGSMVDLTGEGSKKFNLEGVSFVNSETGFAVATNDDRDQGRVLGTSNGGAAWAKKLIGADEGYRDVYFTNANEGWIIPLYGKYIYYTVNGGQYWNSEAIQADQEVFLFRIHGVDATHVWAAGGAAIYHRVVE
ncbi:MAG: hypothetical protein HY231_22110 [Acidobacteria bacterium]|nr:hypothetical protein [Acidobacteriota bacterium]